MTALRLALALVAFAAGCALVLYGHDAAGGCIAGLAILASLTGARHTH